MIRADIKLASELHIQISFNLSKNNKHVSLENKEYSLDYAYPM